jgi:glycosyltransferase involved in cell wall biosynthesis
LSTRIFINARFLTQPITGVQRYAIEVTKAWDKLIDRGEIDAGKFDVALLAPEGVKEDFHLKHIPLRRGGYLNGHAWEQFELPSMARNHPLISMCNAAPALKRNQVVTIHDASVFACPETYPPVFRTWYRMLLRGLGRSARIIITDSDFSRSELVRYGVCDERKIRVVHLSGEHILEVPLDESVVSRNRLEERPFLLAVSSITPNKNFKSLLKAIELLENQDFDVVIAGGTNPSIFSGSEKAAVRRAKYLGRVTDGELRALYSRAACFVYPSFYEGFGLPPVEAMACGCPVIVSRAASMPEVCGDAALYCDPHSPENIASVVNRLMNDLSLQARMRRRGVEHSASLTWGQTALQTLRVYQEAFFA